MILVNILQGWHSRGYRDFLLPLYIYLQVNAFVGNVLRAVTTFMRVQII